MKKYLTKELSNTFLLSLFYYEKEPEKFIKKLYAISNNVENNYEIFEIKKKNGGKRTIYAPKRNLKKIQKEILKNILNKMPVSSAACAYVPKKNIKDNAKIHQNKKIIVKLDIKDFFGSITFGEVLRKVFSYDYYPDSIAVLLTKLCTFYDFVPQGAPTSSYISNIVLKDFDEEVKTYCKKLNIDYTRYSDDLTFSGDFNIRGLISYIRTLLLKRGYLLNEQKIEVHHKNSRQLVTGVVVNECLQVEKSYRKRIRQEMYYIKKFGLLNHMKRINIENKEKYLASLKGRINHCLNINKDDKELQRYLKVIKSIKE